MISIDSFCCLGTVQTIASSFCITNGQKARHSEEDSQNLGIWRYVTFEQPLNARDGCDRNFEIVRSYFF